MLFTCHGSVLVTAQVRFAQHAQRSVSGHHTVCPPQATLFFFMQQSALANQPSPSAPGAQASWPSQPRGQRASRTHRQQHMQSGAYTFQDRWASGVTGVQPPVAERGCDEGVFATMRGSPATMRGSPATMRGGPATMRGRPTMPPALTKGMLAGQEQQKQLRQKQTRMRRPISALLLALMPWWLAGRWGSMRGAVT